ncbi:hypothetical protein ENUP19_0041G0059 [Entamoeba nuttalli]|uniref:Cullin family protein n=2 Tax=Entamoeba nuttalli TaxID=412467 RepID=K2G7G6_ENTNP|nr:cullin family protein [Entamoeba nuttalli P19]EKE38366.1 cullin family protein [Entamoeba nuttalli P19]|eukprot:XP_008859299.1 cullin family protein [Entamoeba nuttalli P19]
MTLLSPKALSTTEYNKLWKFIDSNLVLLFSSEPTKISEMELYHFVYVISIAPGELWKTLYSNLILFLNHFCESICCKMSVKPITNLYIQEYLKYECALKKMEKICKYLTTYYLHESIVDSGKRIWKELVFKPNSFEIINECLSYLNEIRQSKIDQSFLCTFRDCLLSLGATSQASRENYEIFEDEYIKDFELHSSSLLKYSQRDFLEQVTIMEKIEEERVWVSLENTTKARAKKILNDIWLKKSDCVSQLLLQGLDKENDLVEMIFNGCKRAIDSSLLEKLRGIYAKWILTIAYKKLDNFTGDRNGWIEKLVDVLRCINKSLDLFHNDLSFIQTAQITMKNIMSSVPHKNTPNNAMYIALYLHDLLRKHYSNSTCLQPTLNYSSVEVLDLSNYLQDKDVFEEWYLKLLAKRLLNKEAINTRMEENIINKLREMSGVSYATKLGRMFSDIASSISLTNDFNNSIRSTILDVSIGTGGTWPLKPSENIELPPLMNDLLSSFEFFYKRKYESRKLQWVMNMSTTQIEWKYNGELKKVTLPTLAIALVISKSDGFQMKNEGEVYTMYQALIKSEIFDSSGNITSSFLQGYHKKLGITEQKTSEKIKEDRSAWGEAVCVRLMKKMKKCRELDLINMVIKEKAPFIPTEQFVQNVIEKLIEKEYIERDKIKGVLNYLY